MTKKNIKIKKLLTEKEGLMKEEQKLRLMIAHVKKQITALRAEQCTCDLDKEVDALEQRAEQHVVSIRVLKEFMQEIAVLKQEDGGEEDDGHGHVVKKQKL